ncbi:MAG: HEPN domain-containing protein [Bacteroidota bacterium]|nr:HEPN domain-containing protein [Bacteroidota bacterium]
MTDYQPEDYVNYRLNRAKETILEVETLIQNEFWNTAINRLYYACFYAVGALLIKNGIETSSHSGCRQKFGQLFVQTGKINKDLARLYTDLFEKRQKGDYNDFFDFDGDTVCRLFEPSKLVINKIEELIKEK